MTIIHALLDFAAKRPNVEPANYSTLADYRSDAREASRQLQDVRELARVAMYECTNDDMIDAALLGSRIEITPWQSDDGAGWSISYTAGQYYPLEYRRATATLIARALWHATIQQIGDRPDAIAQVRRTLKLMVRPSTYKRYYR
jgi:hypothetical protein